MDTPQVGASEKGPATPSSVSNVPVPAPAVIDHVADEIAEMKENERGPKDFLRVFGYNDTLGWVLNIIALIACIASGVILPLMDVVFGQFVNVFNDSATGSISSSEYKRQINHFSLYFIYLFVAKFGTTYIWTVLVSVTAIRTTAKLRVDFVQQTLRQEVSFFDSPSSSVSAQITTNGNLINTGISEKLGLLIQSTATFVAAFIVAFVVQWKLTLIIFCIVPVNLGVTIVCAYFDTMIEYSMFDIFGQSSSLAEEAFSNIRTAHAFWVFPQLTKRFNRLLDDARKVGDKKSIIYAILFPTEFFCVFSGYGLAFWQGMRMYNSGEIKNVGTVVTVIFAILVAAQALTQLLPQAVTITRAIAAAQELFAIIDRESSIDSLSEKGSEIPNFEGDVKFRNVRFAYPSRSDVPVLHGLDLDLPAGKSTALVGASGSGKSTIFGLLERWYNPEKGSSITLDGHPVESLNLRWLRTNIRLVQQEPTLFSGSIYQNIVDGLVGSDMASLSEDEKHALVVKAAQSAYAHDFIEALPKGYDTYIGERGASLSGGQKQRIVIARSIISNPKVLLLDEATSALDPNAEKIVQQALNNVGKGRTMVTIAHRLSTIRDADRIIVMSKGAVVEQGTHDELIAMGGTYANLVTAQDLSKKDSQEDVAEDSEDGKPVDLDLVATQVTEPGALAEEAGHSNKNEVGLLRGIYLVIREQRSLWVPLFFSFLSCIGGGITFPALAVLFAKTMDAFTKVDVPQANFFALMFFVVALGNLVVYAIAGWIANVLGQQVMRFYRGEIFDSTLRQDMVFFDKPDNSTGALVSRLSSEPTSLQDLLSINLLLMLINIINLLSSSIVAIAFGWKLGLVLALGALPVLVGAGYMRIRLEFKFEEDTAERFAASSGLASEPVMAIRTVSSLALERAVIERYRQSLTGIAQDALKSVGWKMLFYSLSQSISFLCMGLGFWYGGHLVADGEYSNNQFYVVFTAIVFSGESTAQFFQYTTSITKARPAINYVLNLRKSITMKHETDTSDKEADAESKPLLGGSNVRCEDVHFSYPLRPHIPVLKGIDATIGSGKNVAFVGASGCGKSTMIALLERFYDPTRGVLRFDDSDIKTVDRQGHRQGIALVQQEPVLYQGSIRENIAMGVADKDPSDEDIIEACKQANIWTFISSLPEGLSTPCGNQGLSLSGGQRQRIAIARALVRKPRLLLLDEATSALDTESEKVVKEALDKASKGRSTIAVAHRLSTIRDADLICVFDKGRIKEMGTHDELVTKKGMYYEMVLGQSLDKEAA